VVRARPGYVRVGLHLIEVPTPTLLVSAVLAGALMALGAWLILSTPPTFSQLASVWVVTFIIGLGDLHHAIAGSVEVFCALLMSQEITPLATVRFLALALLGNLVGGSLFVAVLNYAHIRRSQALDDAS
jgi:formate/nitrite transporter FocA (FNT family)